MKELKTVEAAPMSDATLKKLKALSNKVATKCKVQVTGDHDLDSAWFEFKCKNSSQVGIVSAYLTHEVAKTFKLSNSELTVSSSRSVRFNKTRFGDFEISAENNNVVALQLLF